MTRILASSQEPENVCCGKLFDRVVKPFYVKLLQVKNSLFINTERFY